eukprot:Nitzschia sp. Nitz4//scaffold173_size47512//3627//5744//NITZ4_007151-RA/size47512-augustus-gene-0.0-mRNA-1//1//CDS//3329538781//4813//frame0
MKLPLSILNSCLSVLSLVTLFSLLFNVEAGIATDATHRATVIIGTGISSAKTFLWSGRDNDSQVSITNVGQGLSHVRTLRFFGRSRTKIQGNSITFRRVDADVPRPMFWKRPASGALHTIGNLTKDVPAEYATVWYGEPINSGVTGSAMFVVAADGSVCGTITDGVDSYDIKSTTDSTGNPAFRVEVKSLEELAAEIEEVGESDSEPAPVTWNRGLLRGNMNPALEPHSRFLQDLTNSTLLVDVAVVYTEMAKNAEGGDAEIQSLIGLSVFQTNIAFRNSGSNIRIRLVQTYEDNTYPDEPSNNGWEAVKTDGDGYFDYWEELRNETGADGIMFISNYLPGWCGRALSGGPISMVQRGCTAKAGRYSFAHELGHWFRAGHDSKSEKDFDNRGYIDEVNCFRTLMAYARCNCSSCPRVLYYSNNITTYEGHAVGTTQLQNNLRTIQVNALDVAMSAETKSEMMPIELCHEDPCEEAPLMVSENYNGDGKCAYVPGDNEFSSLRLPPGIALEAFAEQNFTGDRRVFAASSETDMTNISLQEYDFDLELSSFIIRPLPTSAGVTLCSTYTCLHTTATTLSIGSYRTMSETDIAEDTLSRIILRPGWKVEVFEERRFLGESLVLSNDPENTSPLSIRFQRAYSDWNNRVRSIIIGTI